MSPSLIFVLFPKIALFARISPVVDILPNDISVVPILALLPERSPIKSGAVTYFVADK